MFLTSFASAQIPTSEPALIRIGVLSLFHPQTLIVTSPKPITLLLDGEPHTLSANQPATIHATSTGLAIESSNQTLTAKSLATASATVTLTVPNKLSRSYLGALTVTVHSGELVPVLTMPTELVVASIVAAESPPNAPIEALKAQAIASRSFLLANPNAHPNFDACDTTHCQFLRSPPPAGSPASLATRATRGVVLTWRADTGSSATIVRAMYSRSCGGHTHIPASTNPAAYPYYSVRCEFCLRHPELGGRATYSPGHGVGLCQLGAADLAAHGSSAAQILSHYFPNTILQTLP